MWRTWDGSSSAGHSSAQSKGAWCQRHQRARRPVHGHTASTAQAMSSQQRAPRTRAGPMWRITASSRRRGRRSPRGGRPRARRRAGRRRRGRAPGVAPRREVLPPHSPRPGARAKHRTRRSRGRGPLGGPLDVARCPVALVVLVVALVAEHHKVARVFVPEALVGVVMDDQRHVGTPAELAPIANPVEHFFTRSSPMRRPVVVARRHGGGKPTAPSFFDQVQVAPKTFGQWPGVLGVIHRHKPWC